MQHVCILPTELQRRLSFISLRVPARDRPGGAVRNSLVVLFERQDSAGSQRPSRG